MEHKTSPDPNRLFPVKDCSSVTYIKPSVTRPNIIAGDFTYFGDADFGKQVLHHYEFNGDRLIIGRFCQIASGVTFIMNGANHQMNAATTYPFYIMEGWEQQLPSSEDLPLKGDTVIGNDVWIGQNVTIMPGVHIGDGAIIGLGSLVSRDVEPYTVVAGNPARFIRKRFDDEMTELLLRLRWWDKPVEKIQELIPVLTDSNIPEVKKKLKQILAEGI